MKKMFPFCFVLLLLQLVFAAVSGAYILTKSAPVACGNYIVFQGMNNELYRIEANDLEVYKSIHDPDNDLTATHAVNLIAGHNECLSQPCVTQYALESNNIYYEGSDHELCKIRIDGTSFQDLGKKTKSTPAINETVPFDDFIYFQQYDNNPNPAVNGDNHLCKIRADGTRFLDISAKIKVNIKSTPFVYCEYRPWEEVGEKSIFFQAADTPADKPVDTTASYDNHLCKVSVDGSHFKDLQRKTASRPWVAERKAPYYYGLVYFQSASTDASALNELCSIQTNGHCFRSYRVLALAAPFGFSDGSSFCFQGYDPNLNSCPNLLYLLRWSDSQPFCCFSKVLQSSPTQSPFTKNDHSYLIWFQDQDNHLRCHSILYYFERV